MSIALYCVVSLFHWKQANMLSGLPRWKLYGYPFCWVCDAHGDAGLLDNANPENLTSQPARPCCA